MKCPACKAEGVGYAGPEDARIFLVGEFPGNQEMKLGKPFTGETGNILKKEIFRANLFQYKDCRIGNLWPHPKDKACKDGPHYDRLRKEMKKHEFTLLMGSEFAKVLYEGKVMEMNGHVVDVDGCKAMVCVNPAIVLKAGVGEFRDTLVRFGKWVGGMDE
jgi:uracil-DNA glycosylase family 4